MQLIQLKTLRLYDIFFFYRERYIPITRQSIIRFVIEEQDFLTDEEKKLFPDFSVALDSALTNKYHHVLQELRVIDKLFFLKTTLNFTYKSNVMYI